MKRGAVNYIDDVTDKLFIVWSAWKKERVLMNEKNRKMMLEGISEVLRDMEERYSTVRLECGILNLIYIRYKNAFEIIKEKREKEKIIYISGGVRAYLDSYSDWDNPLLSKMGYVEDLYNKYIRQR